MDISLVSIIISIIIILLSAIYMITRKNKTQLHYVYVLLMLSVLVWSVGAVGEVTIKDVYYFNPIIEVFNFLGISLISVFILLLGIVFTHSKINLSWKYGLLFLLPILSAIAVGTNENHHLFFKIFCMEIRKTVMGPLMIIHYVYCYTFITIGMACLIKYAISNSGVFSKQAIALILGISIPLVVNTLFAFGILEGGCYISLPTGVVFVILTGIANLKVSMFDIVPIALQNVVDHISDSFVVIDMSRKIIDFNKSATLYFNDNLKIGEDFKEFMCSLEIEDLRINKMLDYIQMSLNKKDSISFDTSIELKSKIRHLNIEITPIFNKNKYLGSIVLFKDTTRYVEKLQIIKEYQLLLENNLEKVTVDKQELLIRSAIMENMSKVDALTDMYNHRTFQEYFDTIVGQVSRNNSTLQLAILDIDNFKRINDTFGHSTGDVVLKRLAKKIKTMVTAEDITARYGGEEFAVILTNKTMDESLIILELIRREIEKENHVELNRNVTVSIGMHEYSKGELKEEVFNKADQALYEAKNSGKNCIIVSA